MAYPKPLSEKSLAKMYREANIDEKKSDFLHNVFLASANLYGVIVLRDMWAVLKGCGVTDIKRKDLIAFSSIARRETATYYVYEIDELYSAETRADLDREIVHKSLVEYGFAKKARYYQLAEAQADKPYYIPTDLMAYVAPAATAQETSLLNFLKCLKVTAKEAESRYGRKLICEHTGETLADFSFRNSDEAYEYEYFNGEYKERPSKNEKALQELVGRTSCSEAEKIVRNYKEECNIGSLGPSLSMQMVFEELKEVGVVLSEEQAVELSNLLVEFNNSSRLWCNRGWTPSELSEQASRSGPVSMSFGPGLMQAFTDGAINREELEAELRKMGIQSFR